MEKRNCIPKRYITGYLIFLFSVNNSDIYFYAIDQSRDARICSRSMCTPRVVGLRLFFLLVVRFVTVYDL